MEQENNNYRKKSPWPWVILVVIVIILIGAAVYFYLYYQDQQSTLSNQLNQYQNQLQNQLQQQQQQNQQQNPPPSTTTAKTVQVSIKNFAFSPASLTINKGDTVVWTNEDSVAHTVTGDNGGPNSSNLQQGATYSFTFDTAGTFAYHCTPHPNMKGTVVVQ